MSVCLSTFVIGWWQWYHLPSLIHALVSSAIIQEMTHRKRTMQLPYLPCYVLTFSTLVVLYVTYKSSTLLMGGRENLLTTAWESKIIGFLLLITLNTLRDVKIPYCQGLVTFQSSKRDFLWLADRWDCFKLCYCQFLVAILNDTCLRVSHDGIWWIKPL